MRTHIRMCDLHGDTGDQLVDNSRRKRRGSRVLDVLDCERLEGAVITVIEHPVDPVLKSLMAPLHATIENFGAVHGYLSIKKLLVGKIGICANMIGKTS